MQLSGNFSAPKINTLEICCKFTTEKQMILFFHLQMEINGKEVKVFRKLCAFQRVSNENHFHTTWKNGIPFYCRHRLRCRRILRINSCVSYIKWVLRQRYPKRKRYNSTWSEIVALLNLNKFVCITSCEPTQSINAPCFQSFPLHSV